jgi:hypothetical protein
MDTEMRVLMWVIRLLIWAMIVCIPLALVQQLLA